MWMGDYTVINLVGLLLQAVFIQNILLANFLGMCSYLACSNRVSTAMGLGAAVALVLAISGALNWFVHHYVTGAGALAWIGAGQLDLSFLELILFISIIAGFVQILEIGIEKISPALYVALGTFLPLIAVNCAILGGVLFGITRDYPLIPMFVFSLGSGVGWWLAILLIAAIREKLRYSHIPPSLRGMGITFIMTGLMAMAFMGLLGINLANPSAKHEPSEIAVVPPLPSTLLCSLK